MEAEKVGVMAHKTTLRRTLAGRDMTARGLARVLGMHENSVYAWTAGRWVPEPATALRVARALNVDVSELWPRLGTAPAVASARSGSQGEFAAPGGREA